MRKKSDLDEAALICQRQDENQISDIVIIKDALAKYNQETRFLISKITTAKAAQSKKYESILGHSYFQATVEQGASIELTDKSERAQLLRAFCELMDNYPDAPFDDNLTIEEIEDYCEASEVHHEKVLRLAEYLLPELSSLLNESKIKFTHLWEAKC